MKVIISLNNSLTLLIICVPHIHSVDSRIYFSVLSFSRNLFVLGDFNCHYPHWDSHVLQIHLRKKYSIAFSPLTSFPSMILTPLPSLLCIQQLLPLLTSLLPPFLLLKGALNLESDHLPILLTLSSLFHPTKCLPISRKLVGMTFLFTSPCTVLQRNTSLFLFPMQSCSLPF